MQLPFSGYVSDDVHSAYRSGYSSEAALHRVVIDLLNDRS